ncbi:type IV pilin [Methanosarcina sp. UBA289]|uniref:type IV pilin n=1 Tax=Methanosarcina sp. UBA289 TaxID=1915574 RepID=UPI0025FC4DBC|nr:type IV pilin [Methanosarcina sp. UBA289]
MKAWGKIQAKHFFSFRLTSEAVTPIIGSLLMLLILVVLASIIAISFSNIAEEGKSSQPLMAKISLESCEGGLPKTGKGQDATFENNTIMLIHKGGSSLPLDNISIKISGYGKSYRPALEPGIKGYLTGNISLLYLDLIPHGKNPAYYPVNNKATLEDGLWNVGEKLVLCGQDSAVGATKSSVKVSVDGDYNTSDNYGFKVGSEVTLKVIDTKRSNVIAEQRVIVKHAEG